MSFSIFPIIEPLQSSGPKQFKTLTCYIFMLLRVSKTKLQLKKCINRTILEKYSILNFIQLTTKRNCSIVYFISLFFCGSETAGTSKMQRCRLLLNNGTERT